MRTRHPITRDHMLRLHCPEAVDLMDFRAWSPSLDDYDQEGPARVEDEHPWAIYGPPGRWQEG